MAAQGGWSQPCGGVYQPRPSPRTRTLVGCPRRRTSPTSSSTSTRCWTPTRRPRTDELRVAFRRAVLRHHPDRSGTATTLATRRTSLLNRAWSELRDPVRRRAYDGALEPWRRVDRGRGRWRPASRACAEPRRRAAPAASSGGRAQPVASARLALGGRVPRSGRGLPRRAGGAAPLDRRALHRRPGLARPPRAVLAAVRRGVLPRARSAGRLGRRPGAAGRDRPVLRHPGPLRPARGVRGHRPPSRRGGLPGRGRGALAAGRRGARTWVERELRALLGDFRERHVRRGTPA